LFVLLPTRDFQGEKESFHDEIFPIYVCLCDDRIIRRIDSFPWASCIGFNDCTNESIEDKNDEA